MKEKKTRGNLSGPHIHEAPHLPLSMTTSSHSQSRSPILQFRSLSFKKVHPFPFPLYSPHLSPPLRRRRQQQRRTRRRTRTERRITREDRRRRAQPQRRAPDEPSRAVAGHHHARTAPLTDPVRGRTGLC